MKEYNASYKAYLFDLDGTIYRGSDAIPEAVDVVNRLYGKGIPYVFVTNNSTTPPRSVAEKLVKMGVPCREDQVLTTSMAAASYIKSEHTLPSAPTAYVIGEAGLKEAVESAGIVEKEDNPDYVVMGMDRELTYSKAATAAAAVQNGAVFISTNADKAMPSETGFIPGNGALTSIVALTTGVEPAFMGKPEPMMIDQARKLLGVPKDKLLLVGDNYETDITAGIRAGVSTLHVGTGVTPIHALSSKPALPTHAVATLSDWSL
ncbi:TIGR01457 family HAD-type hydrolase [Salibacterium halotolerans]|uniref:Acid sugar phosphatase n=1 Tax=Salibacterium halotolerans TaxID=1884432 RepID=A0A1I5QZ75_9BACI|nr:TIGR01457 family HAD-type hydrolase [Salibacterium halotolerans]SFP51096.1 4-nitrophenyl phosphatase [Salibacterium halotolerans]